MAEMDDFDSAFAELMSNLNDVKGDDSDRDAGSSSVQDKLPSKTAGAVAKPEDDNAADKAADEKSEGTSDESNDGAERETASADTSEGEPDPNESEEEREARELAEAYRKANAEIEAAEAEEAKKEQEAAEARARAAEEAARKSAESASNDDGPKKDERAELIRKFEEEWPDHAAMVKTLLADQEARIQSQTKEGLKKLVTAIYNDMKPMASKVGEISENEHLRSIMTAHNDFEQIKPQLREWINSKPPFLAKQLRATYTDGETQDVIAMITEFKQEQRRAGKVNAILDKRNKDTGPSDSEVGASRAVDDRRAIVSTAQADQNDYDAAFAEAVKVAATR